jgi:hypothetical protein
MAAQLADADGVIGPFDLKLLGNAAKLKWIQSESAGVENFTFLPGFAQNKIVLTNNKILRVPRSPIMRSACCWPSPGASQLRLAAAARTGTRGTTIPSSCVAKPP